MVIYLLVIGLAVFLDQIVKHWVLVSLKPIGSYPLVEGVFHLTYLENTGAAFSIFEGKQMFLICLTSVVTLAMIGYLVSWSQSEGETLSKLALAMVIGGSIGNLIDRVRLNYVVDFIDFRLINFAVFNIADSFIVVGCVLFAMTELLKKA